MIEQLFERFRTLTGDAIAASNLVLAHAMLGGKPVKEWYSTSEVAGILGKSEFTVRERWCNSGRIECKKDGANWLIPHHELERLQNGGGLSPKR